MTRLEITDFENKEALFKALELVISKGEAKREYITKTGEVKSRDLVKNGHLFVGSNLMLSISTDEKTGKMYLSIDYYGADDRISINKKKEEVKL